MPHSKLPRIGYKKILYTTDLSEEGRLAFPHAASLANTYGAELTVFHVVESREFEKFLEGYFSEDLWNEIRNRNIEEARDILIQRKRGDASIKDSIQQFCEDTMDNNEASHYVSYDVIVDMGEPGDRIIEHAQSGGYDLVVIGKRGRGILQGGLMGDTARRVIRHCKVPVLVVSIPSE
ncbi:MAG: universal stress protein [Candidatus Thiodiazotropha sp. (ex Lucinoma annulata)]|nr:universal stress protein [Candidatus Thiodiazotropha sp. (ex Lucinoma borealis)]MCU7838269.1 universal stress protein [Candidatus Thiodiazotropha sp. (ex Troendleina suluensis)]MCU7886214.1 universal stress protein [Candidatus Thiodiazotropha sp. (ex Lucinoma annulata)]MCU7947945.1 universal stress protein [Candidatus Thiodiazotropha sp. (ex Cardiolucina cf. quadrata)]MCU7865105.1 universal stress protein [Candidatus Thiodiazotropha sp. (ex Lucinoma borealis)]